MNLTDTSPPMRFQEKYQDYPPKQKKLNRIEKFKWILSQNPSNFNHFIAFNYFLEVEKLDDFDTTLSELQVLLEEISLSTILSPEVKEYRAQCLHNYIMSKGIQPTLMWMTLLANAKRHTFQDFSCIKVFLNSMMALNINSDTALDTIFVKGLIQNGNVKDALVLFKSTTYISDTQKSIMGYTILNEQLRINDLTGAMSTTLYLFKSGFPIGVWTAHRLIKAHINQPSVDYEAIDFILMMLKKQNMVITNGIYQTLLLYYQKTDNLEKLKEIEASIIADKSRVVLNRLTERIKYQSLYNDELCDQMDTYFTKQYTTNPNFIADGPTLSLFVKLYCKLSSREIKGSSLYTQYLAKANLYQMRLAHSKMYNPLESLRILMEAFAKAENDTRCRSLMKIINRKGHRSTANEYYHLIDCYCSRGSVILSKEILDEMYSLRIKPSTEIYNRIIQAYLSQTVPNYVKAFDCLQQMSNANVSINDDTLNLFTDSLWDSNDLESSLQWLTYLSKPYLTSMNHMIRMYSVRKDGIDNVLFYYGVLQDAGLLPNVFTYEYLIHAYFERKCYDKCIQLYEELIEKSMVPTKQLVTDVVSCLQKLKDIDGLKKIKSHLISNLDFDLSNDYLMILLELKLHQDALQWIQNEMMSNSITPKLDLLNILLSAPIESSLKEKLMKSIQYQYPYHAKSIMKLPIPKIGLNPRQLHDLQTRKLESIAINKRLTRKRIRMTDGKIRPKRKPSLQPIKVSQLDPAAFTLDLNVLDEKVYEDTLKKGFERHHS
ncbi:hypothetical protein BC833DRAFT_587143 [Globomyces pollinis-pini]|nr:hypothetical protein BC833DRAFT_587143 [Globomyces pollinis-pini]